MYAYIGDNSLISRSSLQFQILYGYICQNLVTTRQMAFFELFFFFAADASTQRLLGKGYSQGSVTDDIFVHVASL